MTNKTPQGNEVNIDKDIMRLTYELYKQWCRLNNYSLPKSSIEIWFDEKSGIQDKQMTEFVKWFGEVILKRIEL